jgi:hypothetical protein
MLLKASAAARVSARLFRHTHMMFAQLELGRRYGETVMSSDCPKNSHMQTSNTASTWQQVPEQ